MEEINNKAYEDELNKAQEEIQESPRHRIPVTKPEIVKDKFNKEKKQKNYG